MNICIVGTGYVGLVTGACLAEFGMNLICVDNDHQKIALLRKGGVPIYEPGLEDLVRKNMKEGRLRFSASLQEGVLSSLVIFIAVGTPSQQDGSADLSAVESVAREIAQSMEGYKVVVVKSTVPVGTSRRLKTLIESHQNRPIPFDMASNPEFLREGSAVQDFMRPDRVAIGAESEQSVAIMKDIYSALYLNETPFVITSLETAEMIKYATNAFLATKVTFINGRCRCPACGKGHGPGRKDRKEVPPSGSRVWRLLFSEGHTGPFTTGSGKGVHVQGPQFGH
jgi:UDPglucose 6-dehydrogenase